MSRLTECAGILAAAAVLAGCQTAKPGGIPWETIARADSAITFEGTPRPETIYTEALVSDDGVRHERIFLLSNTYAVYRSRIELTLSDKPLSPAATAWVRDPEALTRLALTSRCDDALLSPVKEASNANGRFLYLSCRRKGGDRCVLAGQEIGGNRFAAIEWLLCTTTDEEAENLAKFGSLRIKGIDG